MFNNKETSKTEVEVSNERNHIGKGTTLEGNIETFGNIRIEGKVIGNIKSKSKVALGESSFVEGNLLAQNAEIEGEVKGFVEVTELLVLKPSAVIHGDITTSKLIVETGANFNGNCKMGNAAKEIKFEERFNSNKKNDFVPKEEIKVV